MPIRVDSETLPLDPATEDQRDEVEEIVKPGQLVEHEFYGKTETARISSLSRDGKIVFLDNGRWMHVESVRVKS